MIEINGKIYPEDAIESITRTTQGDVVLLSSGLRQSGVAFDWQVIPNTTPTQALVVWVDDDGLVLARELPVVAWRVNRIDGDCAEAVLAGDLVPSEAYCLFAGRHYWIPGEADFDSREAAVDHLCRELERRSKKRTAS